MACLRSPSIRLWWAHVTVTPDARSTAVLRSGTSAGLKLVYGGSIPSFLVNLFVLVRMLVLQMCGKVEGTRAITLRL